MGFALEKVGYTTELKTVTCCVCGTPFAMEQELHKNKVKDHSTFHCPNGHGQSFKGKSEEEKLKEQLAEQSKRFASELNLRLEAEAQLKRIKTRIGNGTCPCCNRSFSNLHRHMKAKHPEYKKSSPTKIG